MDQDLDGRDRVSFHRVMAGLLREDLMTLSPSELGKKLQEVGLPKTLTQCLEGWDCIEQYVALLLII